MAVGRVENYPAPSSGVQSLPSGSALLETMSDLRGYAETLAGAGETLACRLVGYSGSNAGADPIKTGDDFLSCLHSEQQRLRWALERIENQLTGLASRF